MAQGLPEYLSRQMRWHCPLLSHSQSHLNTLSSNSQSSSLGTRLLPMRLQSSKEPFSVLVMLAEFLPQMRHSTRMQVKQNTKMQMNGRSVHRQLQLTSEQPRRARLQLHSQRTTRNGVARCTTKPKTLLRLMGCVLCVKHPWLFVIQMRAKLPLQTTPTILQRRVYHQQCSHQLSYCRNTSRRMDSQRRTVLLLRDGRIRSHCSAVHQRSRAHSRCYRTMWLSGRHLHCHTSQTRPMPPARHRSQVRMNSHSKCWRGMMGSLLGRISRHESDTCRSCSKRRDT